MVSVLETGRADISPWTGLLSNRNETSVAPTAIPGWNDFLERQKRDEPTRILGQVLHSFYSHHLDFSFGPVDGVVVIVVYLLTNTDHAQFIFAFKHSYTKQVFAVSNQTLHHVFNISTRLASYSLHITIARVLFTTPRPSSRSSISTFFKSSCPIQITRMGDCSDYIWSYFWTYTCWCHRRRV